MKSSSALYPFIPFLILLSFSSTVSSQKPKCHPQDQKAINKIKLAFGINPTGDCCDWEYIVCDTVAPYRVLQFEVFDSDISGQLPAAIGDLSSLRTLGFTNVSKLTGNIPSTIANLSQLLSFSIIRTNVSGPIPKFPKNKKLITIHLQFNSLTGSIPPEIATTIPELEQLELQGNQLTGTIPESFGQLPKNTFYINLSNNSLKGAVPKSLGNLNLRILDLSRNKFIGDASFLFGKNKETLYLYLNNNHFKFNLSNVEYPSQLTSFDVSHNNIFGGLRPELTQFSFTRFNVSYNQLCGKIPHGGSLHHLGSRSFSHNKCLCGAPLPRCK